MTSVIININSTLSEILDFVSKIKKIIKLFFLKSFDFPWPELALTQLIQTLEKKMTVINTNVGALQARVASLGAQTNMEKAMQRLSSGLRINSAADDAAGLAVATKMESQLRGINMSIRNAQDGVGLIQTAESGVNEIRNMVLRMRELAVQMANGIYEDTPDRNNAQLEVTALINQVTLIAENTRFNDVALLDGSFTTVNIQAGNTTAETIELSFVDMASSISEDFPWVENPIDPIKFCF